MAGESCGATSSAGCAPSPQETSAGRMRVEMCRRARAAAMAVAASEATSPTVPLRRTQPDTVPATESMSDSSGASYFLW